MTGDFIFGFACAALTLVPATWFLTIYWMTRGEPTTCVEMYDGESTHG